MRTATQSQKLEDFLSAIQTAEPVRGLTHLFYRYPACFSPRFARAAIRAFTHRGDTVLDPFMGGGTTLVEASSLGRRAVGNDLNTLAKFVASVKTTVLSETDVNDVTAWGCEVAADVNMHSMAEPATEWQEAGYQRNVPWPTRKFMEVCLGKISQLAKKTQQRYARCVLLRLGQWAVDSHDRRHSASDMRTKLRLLFGEFQTGMTEYRMAVTTHGSARAMKPLCFGKPTHALSPDDLGNLPRRPSLVVTSPPYPGVYVLYHRWKVGGRKESPAPYWIADCLDGHGQAHYCFGDRRSTGLNAYFEGITRSYAAVRELVTPDALVIQLVAFADPESQLQRFLVAMNDAGFDEVAPASIGLGHRDRIWRPVPGRRWFARAQGELATSREIVLFHRPS